MLQLYSFWTEYEKFAHVAACVLDKHEEAEGVRGDPPNSGSYIELEDEQLLDGDHDHILNESDQNSAEPSILFVAFVDPQVFISNY